MQMYQYCYNPLVPPSTPQPSAPPLVPPSAPPLDTQEPLESQAPLDTQPLNTQEPLESQAQPLEPQAQPLDTQAQQPLDTQAQINNDFVGGYPLNEQIKDDVKKIDNLKIKILALENNLKKIKSDNDKITLESEQTRLIDYYNNIIKKYDEYEKQPGIEPTHLSEAIKNKQIYENKLKNLNDERNKEKNKNKKVYGIILNLTLYPGENPSIMDKQSYKCTNSFNNLKKEYCQVFGIGCDDKNKKVGGTLKNKLIRKKHTMKNKKYYEK
jgi:hypothetical protein